MSRRIDFWDVLTWLMLTIFSAILWLVLLAVFDASMSWDEFLGFIAAMAALWLLLIAAMR